MEKSKNYLILIFIVLFLIALALLSFITAFGLIDHSLAYFLQGDLFLGAAFGVIFYLKVKTSGNGI